MSCYKHLTIEERESILVLRAQKMSVRKIAAKLKRAPSTISRELNRNHKSHEKCKYSPSAAQLRYYRMKRKPKGVRRLKEEAVLEKVEALLVKGRWTPEEITNRLKLEKSTVQISLSTIYRGIRRGLLSNEARECLQYKGRPHKNRKRKNRCGRIPVDYSIHDRPEKIETREECGHWESDTVVGKGQEGIATHVERKSRYSVFLKLPKRNHTATYMEATEKAFREFPAERRQSFTVDNGKEFAGYRELMKALGCIVYFADPYSPWQRGTNENTNGLLRRFVAKGADLSQVTQEQLDQYADLLNTRPRKCLGWRTPYEVLYQEVLHLT